MTTQKKEFNMKQVFALWLRQSKSGKQYLSGKDENGKKLVGFINSHKKNPKEPDLRVYEVIGEEIAKEEYTSLWLNTSKAGKQYMTGKVGGKKVVGFINPKHGGKRPYVSVYESEETPKTQEPTTAAAPPEFPKPEDAVGLPF